MGKSILLHVSLNQTAHMKGHRKVVNGWNAKDFIMVVGLKCLLGLSARQGI